MAKKITQDSTVKFFVTVIGLTVIAIVLRELGHIFIPFVIAYFLFFLFTPLNHFFEKKKIPQPLIVIIDLAVTLLVAFGASKFIVDSFIRFGEQFPVYEKKLSDMIQNAAVSLGITDPNFTNFSIEKILSNINFPVLAGGIFSSTFSLLGNILFVLFFFVFVMSGHKMMYEAVKKRYVNKKVKPELKKIKRKFKNDRVGMNSDFEQWMGDQYNIEIHSKEEKFERMFKAIIEQIQRYIISKIIINLSTAVSAAVILALFGLDFPVIWGVFIFLLNFIPTIGSAFALILPVIMALIQFGSFGYALLIALVLAVLQTISFNVIEPSALGKRLNLNPLLILFSLLIWGYIWGIVGMLLSVPLTAIIKIIISNSDSKNLIFLNDIMSAG